MHNLIDMIPKADADVIYKVLIKFIPNDDKVKSISDADISIQTDGTIPIPAINRD